MKDRLHLWRVLNEYVASTLAKKLELTVPEAILITSGQVSQLKLEPDQELPLPEDEIILDDEHTPETAEEYYQLSSREHYIIETSEQFEEILTGLFNQTSQLNFNFNFS